MDDDDLKAPCAWCDRRLEFSWDGKDLTMEWHDDPIGRLCDGSNKGPVEHLTKMSEDDDFYN